MKRLPPPSVPLWQNRDYLLLWSGQVVSSLGSQVSQLALPLLLLALTHSPAQAGVAGALRATPYLIFSLPAGALIDRWDRKRVMIVCDTGRALSLVSLAIALWLGRLTLVQIYLVSLIEGTLYVFFNLAEAACLPRVVSKEQLPAATAQNLATFNISTLLGGPLGGTLYSVSQVLPFVADAASYALSVLSLLRINTPFQEERAPTARKLWREIKDGLLWLWGHQLIRSMALLTGGLNLLMGGYSLLAIVLLQHLHASPLTIGLVFAAVGIGGIVGTVIAPSIQKRFSFGQVIIATCWGVSLLWPLYTVSPTVVSVGVISTLIFLAFPLYDTVQFSYRSAIIPDALQGRVNSVFRLFAFAGQPLGLALTGVFLQTLTIFPTILVFAGGFWLLALAATLNVHIRQAHPFS